MDKNENIKDKAIFYFAEKLKAHITLLPEGFLNGHFDSDLTDNTYYWFIDDKNGRVRIFLSEIYNIREFTEKKEGVGV